MHELAYNLESFNPAFTAVLLRVQQTIGVSDYVRRDTALKHLIQPLAGEYGMHNDEAQARTHRELFSIFYVDLMREPLEALLAADPAPPAAARFFAQMMRDLNGRSSDPMRQVRGCREGGHVGAADPDGHIHRHALQRYFGLLWPKRKTYTLPGQYHCLLRAPVLPWFAMPLLSTGLLRHGLQPGH
jgi:hypothetical protein